MIKQSAIIFGCLLLAEAFVYLTGIGIPSSIVGMLILTCLLKFRVIRLQHVKTTTDFFINNLAFFFIPPGVAIMLYTKLMLQELMPVVLASVLSTVLVLAVSGWVFQLIRR